MSKKRLLPTITALLFLASCSGEMKDVVINMTQLIRNKIGMISRVFNVRKDQKFTFKFNYEKIDKDFINDNPYGNMFYFNTTIEPLMDLFDEDSIKIRYNDNVIADSRSKHIEDIDDWYSRFVSSERRTDVENTFVYGEFLPGRFILLFCSNVTNKEKEKKSNDEITITARGKGIFTDAYATIIPSIPTVDGYSQF